MIKFGGTEELRCLSDWFSICILGSGALTLDGPSVVLNRWQTVHMVRQGRQVILSIGVDQPQVGVDSDVFRGETPGGNTGLSLGSPLLIGGSDNQDNLHPSVVVSTGLVGCISEILVSNFDKAVTVSTRPLPWLNFRL